MLLNFKLNLFIIKYEDNESTNNVAPLVINKNKILTTYLFSSWYGVGRGWFGRTEWLGVDTIIQLKIYKKKSGY